MMTHRSSARRVALVIGLALATMRAGATDHPLSLDDKATADAGIVVDTLGTHAMAETVVAPGEVRIDAYATVLVSPRVTAQVIERKARLGDMVAAGNPLVVLSSIEVAEAQGRLIVASEDWARVSALGPQAVSGRRYAEAQVARDQARAALRAYGLGDAQIAGMLRRGSPAADGRFELVATRAGRITSDDFLVGERVEPGKTLFTVVTEDTVWVEAQLPPAVASQVTPRAEASIAAQGRTWPAHVVQRAHRTDEGTRTAGIRLRVDNRDDLLHPGDPVNVRIATGGSDTVLAVPADAVVLLQNQTTLFVRGNDGRFEPTPVEVGETRGGWTPIRRGVAAGSRYAREGAFVLKARLLRSQLGDE